MPRRKTKNRIRILILGSALLTGCMTSQQKMEQGLQSLHGQHLQVAMQRLGVPVGEENVAGMRIVVWSLNETRTDYVTQTTDVSAGVFGIGAAKDIEAEVSVDTPVLVHAHCTVKLRIGTDDIVQGSDYSGDLKACRRYIRDLKRGV